MIPGAPNGGSSNVAPFYPVKRYAKPPVGIALFRYACIKQTRILLVALIGQGSERARVLRYGVLNERF